MHFRIVAASRFFAFARPGNWFVSKIPPLLAVPISVSFDPVLPPATLLDCLPPACFLFFVLRSTATS